MRVRTVTPVPPLGPRVPSRSDNAVPAMSRCAHGTPSVNSRMKSAATMEPAPRWLEMLLRSAMSLLSPSL